MKQATIIALVCIVILIALAVVLIFDIGRQAPSYATISNFDECSKAGYPILESYPPQCSTPDGRTFTQIIATTTSTATPQPSPVATTSAAIQQTSVKANQVVTSPLIIKGTALGSWFFEASFPIKVVDANGNILGQGTAQALGDWMTANYVPFQSTLTFATSTTKTGTLMFEKDNPSGDPAHDESISIPITFHQ